MRKQDHLFFLIKSLTTTEKRYFKRLTALNGNGDKCYMELFDWMDKQTKSDDRLIKEHFKGRDFLKQLPVMKNYLTALIMKSLRHFTEKNSKGSEIREALREIEILLNRELYAQARVTIEKVIKLASRYERFEMLLEAYRYKRLWLQSTAGIIKARNEIREIIALENQITEKIRTINQLQDLNYALMDNDFGDDNANVLNHPLLTSGAKETSLHAFVHAQHFTYAASAFSNDLDGGLKALDSILVRLENNPHRIREDPSSYITVLNNKVGALLHTRELDKIPELLQQIRSTPEKYKISKNRNRIKTFLSTYNVELELYRDSENWSKGVSTINEISGFLAQNEKEISAEHRITFYYQFAYIFFMTGDFSTTLKYLNELISSNFEEIRIDIATYARFLNLMCHYELGNVIVLRYAVESCRRFLRKRRQPQHFEKTLLRFFSKASTSPKSAHQELFQWLKANLFRKTTAADQENILDYLNFEKWIDKHLEAKTKTAA